MNMNRTQADKGHTAATLPTHDVRAGLLGHVHAPLVLLDLTGDELMSIEDLIDGL